MVSNCVSLLLCLLYYSSQDLKPSNVAVNEDCELRVRPTLHLNQQILYCNLWTQSLRIIVYLSDRSLTLDWPGKQMTRWQGTWQLAGIERRRSCWIGCTTIRMVRLYGFYQVVIIFLETKSLNVHSLNLWCFCSSWYLVSGMHYGGAAEGKSLVSWHWLYPLSAWHESTAICRVFFPILATIFHYLESR